MNRRQILQLASLIPACAAAGSRGSNSPADHPAARTPVIDITDLYHPPQDPGDNFDLIAPYALPSIDLKAVIFDVTARFRRKVAAEPGSLYQDDQGPRDPGFIPVTQLNALFGRNVPCACAPFVNLRAPDDPARDAPAFQQAGITLLCDILRAAPQPVHIVSFGSARPLAIAFNREPDLLRSQIARIHLCAGAAPPGYLEWNVMLDPLAFVRLLASDLPLAIYPCATDQGPFELGIHNTYWQLPDLDFLPRLHPGLVRYLAYAFSRSTRVDFLRALEEDPPADLLESLRKRPHHVWETAVWAQVADLALARRDQEPWRLIPRHQLHPDDTILRDDLLPCRLAPRPDDQFTFTPLPPAAPARQWIYHRPDPQAQQAALRQALPALYESFQPARP
jgi:hypothetical protein